MANMNSRSQDNNNVLHRYSKVKAEKQPDPRSIIQDGTKHGNFMEAHVPYGRILIDVKANFTRYIRGKKRKRGARRSINLLAERSKTVQRT